jgi:hypothetical protein
MPVLVLVLIAPLALRLPGLASPLLLPLQHPVGRAPRLTRLRRKEGGERAEDRSRGQPTNHGAAGAGDPKSLGETVEA